MRNRQHGVALVTILLVVSIATVMAVAMIREQQAAIQVTRAFLGRGQVNQYALGGEELARQILREDFDEHPERDHLAEVWADPALHFEFEQGEVNLRITDLQGLFNLNGLMESNPRHGVSRQRFINLVNAAGGDPMIADRVQDWLDRDNSVRPTGAEDFDYLAYEPPYRAGNGLMADPSEFFLLGVPPEIQQMLASHLVTLPRVQSGLNINTAPAALIQSLAASLSYEAADALVQRRDEQEGFESVAEFLQSSELAGLGVAGDGLGVQSSFFEIRVIARYQDRFGYLTSIVHRHPVTGIMRVIQRDFSRNFRPEARQRGGQDRG